jgi:16S rRNA (guanine1207-N2)-methyltransferase
MQQPPDLAALRAPIRFEAELAGRPLRFESTWGLFSPREIDAGTALLLRHVEVPEHADCLDLGCGYGPIGCTLAALAPKGRTLMVDKDFVAVELARRNAQLNGLANAEAALSNGFEHIDPARRFDLIASNIPAKVGKELLTLLLYDARARLNPGGRLYVVTVNGLREFMQRYLRDVFGNYDKLKQGAHYTVAMAER